MSKSVAVKSTRVPTLEIKILDKIGNVWRCLPTIPLTAWTGVAKASRGLLMISIPLSLLNDKPIRQTQRLPFNLSILVDFIMNWEAYF